MSWSWFFMAVGVGVVLLGLAMLADRRQSRARTGVGQPAPKRGVASVDQVVPHYLTQDDVDAMDSPAAGSESLPHRGEGFGFGYAHPDFATSRSGAFLERPRILVVDGDVTSMRELLAPLSTVSPDAPLVVVAAGFVPEVLTTLAANRRALHLALVAASAGERDRRRLAELTGASPLSGADLQAGYVPAEAFGKAVSYAATATKSWVA